MKKIYYLLTIFCYFTLHNMNMDFLPLDVVQNYIVPCLIDYSEILEACDQENKDKTLHKSMEAFLNFSRTNKTFNQCCRDYLPIFLQQSFTYENIFAFLKTNYNNRRSATLLEIKDRHFFDDDSTDSITSFDLLTYKLGTLSFYITLNHIEQKQKSINLKFALNIHSSVDNAIKFTQAIDNFKLNFSGLLAYIHNYSAMNQKEKQKFKDCIKLFQNIIEEAEQSPVNNTLFEATRYDYPSGSPESIYFYVDLSDKNYHEFLANFLLKYGFSSAASIWPL